MASLAWLSGVLWQPASSGGAVTMSGLARGLFSWAANGKTKHMPKALSQRLFTLISDRRYVPQTIPQLADEVGADVGDVTLALNILVDSERAMIEGDQTVQLPEPGKEVTGKFRANERGFGFLLTDHPYRYGDLFVPPDRTNGAMDGDTVRAQIKRDTFRSKQDPTKSPYLASIAEVLERNARPFAGTLTKSGDKYFVVIDGRLIKQPVPVADPAVKGANPGDKVVIDLIEHPDDYGHPGEGVITKVLGEAGLPDVETQAVMAAYGLDEGFDEAVTQQAREAAKSFDDEAVPSDREDLTDPSKILITTIDPPTAKDFDDAISLKKFDKPQKDGAAWELGVHIADVAHFVTQGSALDDSAKKRGNSTYLPRRVIPMLPEILSNGVCSLNPGVNRFAKSCFIRYTESGKVIGTRFSRSVIRSAKRMTYLEAQALIDDDIREARKHAKTEPKYPREVIQQVKLMDELSRVIRQRRMDDGMIVLGLPEVELVYNDLGHVVDAEPEDTAFTHTIIEMFMVEANEAAARLFYDLGLPMIRRTHPDPTPGSPGKGAKAGSSGGPMADLSSYAKVAGVKLPPSPGRKDLQALLEKTRGTDAAHAVHLAVLKTLMRAEYSPLLIGHFALASEHYTHFTSPIRRYPDLIVHRGIDAYLEASGGGKKMGKAVVRRMLDDERVWDESELRDIGANCSSTERNSEQAEKSLRMYLVLQLLELMVGDDFGGTITGLNNRGIFVEIDKYLVDGFIQTRELARAVGIPGERFRLDPRTNTLVGQQSGTALRIGQRLKVRIAKVDLAKRQMDLAVLEVDGKKGRSQRAKQDRKLEQMDPDEARTLRRSKKAAKGGSKKSKASGSGSGSGESGGSKKVTKGRDRNRYKQKPGQADAPSGSEGKKKRRRRKR